MFTDPRLSLCVTREARHPGLRRNMVGVDGDERSDGATTERCWINLRDTAKPSYHRCGTELVRGRENDKYLAKIMQGGTELGSIRRADQSDPS